MNATIIRPARPHEGPALTKLTFVSKRTWEYPETWFDIWREELTITAAYIEKNTVRLAETDGRLSGYYTILYNKEDKMVCGALIEKGYWLDHIFVAPFFFKKGIGTRLFHNACETALGLGASTLRVLAEPKAAGFYRKIGAEYVGEFPSNIPGRTTPFFRLSLSKKRET
jgi:GNAT superfamily N-acetyltransferase